MFATAYKESEPIIEAIVRSLWPLLGMGSNGQKFDVGNANRLLKVVDKQSVEIFSEYRRDLSRG